MAIIHNMFFSVTDGLLEVFFLHEFMKKKKTGLLEVLFFTIYSFVGYLATGDVENNMLWMLMGLLLNIIYAYIISNKHWIRAVVAAMVSFLVMGIVSMIVIFATATIMRITLDEALGLYRNSNLIFGSLFAKVIAFVVMILILKLVKKSIISYLNRIGWSMIVVLLFLVSIVLFALFYTVLAINVEVKIMHMYSICAIAMVCFAGMIFWILLKMSILNYKQAKYRQKLVLYKMQEKNMLQLKEEYKHVRMVKHDLRHYLGTATSLMEQGKTEEALNYVRNDVGQKIENLVQMVDTGNDIIDVTLNSKMLYAKNHNIDFCIKLESSLDFAKKSTDVGVVLANLLDNALFAAIQSKEKWVKIHSVEKNEYLQIDIENSYSKTYEAKKERTKEHGWGLVSVEEILRELQGELRKEIREKEYRVSVMLKKEL